VHWASYTGALFNYTA